MGAKQSNAMDPSSSKTSGRTTPDAATKSTKSNRAKASKDKDNLLTPHQKVILRAAWKHMNKNMGNMIFRRMVSKNPDISRIFQKASSNQGVNVLRLSTQPISAQQHHSAVFFDLLDLAMQDLDKLDSLAAKCYEYGANHAQYKEIGFKMEHWDSWGESLTESAREWEGWRTHREALRAWTRLISLMVDRLRAGYQQGLRKNVQKNESEAMLGGGIEEAGPEAAQLQLRPVKSASSASSMCRMNSRTEMGTTKISVAEAPGCSVYNSDIQ